MGDVAKAEIAEKKPDWSAVLKELEARTARLEHAVSLGDPILATCVLNGG